MVYLVHWTILYRFSGLTFSFDPNPFHGTVSLRMLRSKDIVRSRPVFEHFHRDFLYAVSGRCTDFFAKSLPTQSPAIFQDTSIFNCRPIIGRGVCVVVLPLLLRHGVISFHFAKLCHPDIPARSASLSTLPCQCPTG